MIITLTQTSAAAIANTLVEARRNAGVSSGMVFTLLVVADGRPTPRVLDACIAAGREHPSRILLIVEGGRAQDRLDAEIRIGEDVPGEIITLRFHGELVNHQASVILPLLLPDSPVIAWWPGLAPDRPSEDQIGALAERRITDAMGAPDHLAALDIRAANLQPGDTDLTWTRLTPFRGLLALALDQHHGKVESATIEAAEANASAFVLAAWLEDRLKIPVTITASRGPGITAIRLTTDGGEISIVRKDGQMATFTVPGLPPRKVALRRVGMNQLITEELRRMDADDVLQATMARLVARGSCCVETT